MESFFDFFTSFLVSISQLDLFQYFLVALAVFGLVNIIFRIIY